MKSKLNILLVALFSASYASGAVSLTGTNFDLVNGQAILITDGAGNGVPSTGYSWAAGNFSNTTFTDAVSVITNFTINGAASLGNPSFPGAFGTTNNTGATSTDGSDSFSGTPIFIVVGNSAVFGDSTDYIVFQSNALWPVEAPAVGASITVDVSDPGSQILYGFTTTVQGATGPFAAFNGTDGVTFGAIPEPSVALLGAFGVLGLLRRRR